MSTTELAGDHDYDRSQTESAELELLTEDSPWTGGEDNALAHLRHCILTFREGLKESTFLLLRLYWS